MQVAFWVRPRVKERALPISFVKSFERTALPKKGEEVVFSNGKEGESLEDKKALKGVVMDVRAREVRLEPEEGSMDYLRRRLRTEGWEETSLLVW